MSVKGKKENPTSVPNLWRNSFKPAIKKVAGWGFLAGVYTMIQINEYALALLLLILSAIAFVIQISEWKGIEGQSRATNTVKSFLFIFVIVVIVYFAGVVYMSKGDKPWSTWLIVQPDKNSIAIKPSPTPNANILVTKPQSEKPAFSEKTNRVVVSLGEEEGSAGYGYGFDVSQVSSKKQQIISGTGGRLGEVYIEDGVFYFDVDLYFALKLPPLKLRRRQLEGRPDNWDLNYSENALEVVDEKQRVRFQYYYKSEGNIVLKGIFLSGRHIHFVDKQVEAFALSGHPVIQSRIENALKNFVIKPIFKYPSWKYRGKFAE